MVMVGSSSMGTASDAVAAVGRDLEIPNVCRALTAVLDQLEKNEGELYQRIALVQRMVPPAQVNKEGTPPSRGYGCGLAQGLNEQLGRAERIVARLADALDRLEL